MHQSTAQGPAWPQPSTPPPLAQPPPAGPSEQEARQRRQLRELIDRLKTLLGFQVPRVDDATRRVVVLYEAVAEDWEVFFEQDVPRHQMQTLVGAQLQRWWRYAAEAKRAWQHCDTVLRNWKSARIVEAITPPAGQSPAVEEEGAPPEEGPGAETGAKAKKAKKKPDEWKPPAQWQAEAMYRARPEYLSLNADVERAEAAHTACLGVVDAWQTIGRILAATKEVMR